MAITGKGARKAFCIRENLIGRLRQEVDLLQHTKLVALQATCQEGLRPDSLSQPVDEQTGTDPQSFRVVRLEEPGLERRQLACLHKRINPNGVECRQIMGQSSDARTATWRFSR